MTDKMLAPEVEGRLLAHRKLLARLIAASSNETRLVIGAWLAARESLTDGPTDPDALPHDGLDLEMAMSDELHQISEIAQVLITGESGSALKGTGPAFYSLRHERGCAEPGLSGISPEDKGQAAPEAGAAQAGAPQRNGARLPPRQE